MLIRVAVLADLAGCAGLDADSQTHHVWQMDERRENEHISLRFQRVRLPRVMRVAYPRDRDDLVTCWENGSTVLVATNRPMPREDDLLVQGDEPEPLPRIFGYCQLDLAPWQNTAWITHLIVDRRLRRRTVGSALMTAAVAWGRRKGLDRLMVAVQTKNYPAIAFCEKHGLAFCGYNDHYFPNRDIAVFFTLKL